MKRPSTVCQSFTTATAKVKTNSTDCLGPRARSGSVRTAVLLDDSRIVEIYHLDRQATRWGIVVGERFWSTALPVHMQAQLLYRHLRQQGYITSSPTRKAMNSENHPWMAFDYALGASKVGQFLRESPRD